jgi:hypothetical protein
MKAESTHHRRRGRPLTRKDKNGRSVPVRADRDSAVKTFFDAVPRTKLDDAMRMSGDHRFYRLHDAIHDAAYRNMSKGTLCRKLGISLQDLFDVWRQYNLHMGMIQMENHLPEILVDLAVDSLSREAVCPQCDGIGVRELKRVCPVCGGVGSV